MDDLDTLRERVQVVIHETKTWFSLRHEAGELLVRSLGFFTAKSTKQIALPDTSWPVVSGELALVRSPLGYCKLPGTDRVLRKDQGVNIN